MIPSPNAYFTAEEAKTAGARPITRFIIHPFYFDSGIGSGRGTFVDCAYQAPGSVVVDWGVETASWTSEVLTNPSGEVPTNVRLLWDTDQGPYTLTVEYKTAPVSADLAGAAWATATEGVVYSVHRYYQLRFTWVGCRSWAFDVEDVSDQQAYANDAYDPDDPYCSYATDGLGTPVFIGSVMVEGEYLVPTPDVKDGGQLTLALRSDFSELTSGDHTLTLVNQEGRYSPGHPSFIFADDDHWFLKGMKVEIGYERPGSPVRDTVLVFDGLIMGWGPVNYGIGADGKLDEQVVEIFSRDRLAYLLQKKVGVPLADGTPAPLVYGELFQQATQVADKMYGDPMWTANFDGGNLVEFSDTALAGNGTIEASSGDPYAGSYCCRVTASTSNSSACGWLDTMAPLHSLFFTGMIRFNSYPTTPSNRLVSVLRMTGTSYLYLEVAPDGHVVLNVNGTLVDTSWYIDDYAGSFRRVSIGIYGTTTGVIRVWVDGSEVGSIEGNLSTTTWQEIQVGVFLGATAESYNIDWDSLQVWYAFEPTMYQLPGYPFTSIDQVFIDGSIRMDRTPGGPVSRIISGRTPGEASFILLPAEGSVVFTDMANQPSGTVSFRVRKNTTTHPVDVIADLITQAVSATYVDTASFAAAKALTPTDVVNAYVDNMAAGDAVKEVASRCLIHVFMDQGLIKVKAYTGYFPTGSVITIGSGNGATLEENLSMDEIVTSVSGKWGNYEQNKQLYYEKGDPVAQTYLGIQSQLLDFSWGSPVTSESSTTVKRKVDALLAKLKGAVDTVSVLSPLWHLARVELGDTVLVDLGVLRSAATFTVYSKTLTLAPPYTVSMSLVRYLGESEGD
jgi:hypothetical protein